MVTGFKSGIPFLGEKTPKTPTTSGDVINQDSSMIDIEATNISTGALDLNGLDNASFSIIRNIKNSSEIVNSIIPNNLNNLTGSNQVINQNSAGIKLSSLSQNQVFPLVITQPQSRMIFINSAWKTIFGTWTLGARPQQLGVSYISDILVNNEIAYYLPLENREYNFKILGVLDVPNFGITTVRIDGNIVTTFDSYGATTYNVIKSFNFTPTFNGEHKISLKSESKNVGSSGYKQDFTWLCITPTTWRDRF